MLRLLPVLLLVAAQAAVATPRKVAVRTLINGEGVSEKLALTVAESVAAELRKLPDLQVSTHQEILAALSIEQQKKLLSCDDAACNANFGETLGVEAVVTGNLSRLGESWLVNLKLIDVVVVETLAQADRRLRGGSIDDVLDVLPAMAAELFGAEAPSSMPVVLKTAAPQGGLDVPADVSAIRSRLKLFTDGQGRYVAWDPQEGSFDPFYAGSREKLWAQRISGGGRTGDTSFNRIFWEPRVKAPWQGAFEMKDGAYWLQCGDAKVTLTEVEEKEARQLLDAARFFAPRWQRHLWLLGRNDLGDYFLVDHAREPRGNQDFRLYVGPKGRVAHVVVDDAISDEAGEVFLSSKGRLRLDRASDALEWIDASGARIKLVKLDLYSNAMLVYGALGAYTGQALGTACDGKL